MATPANFATSQGYLTVPATAKFAFIVCRATVAAGGVNPYAVMMEPMLARVPVTQVATAVAYQAGRENPLGDQTAVNVAPSIVGQGSQATGERTAGGNLQRHAGLKVRGGPTRQPTC